MSQFARSSILSEKQRENNAPLSSPPNEPPLIPSDTASNDTVSEVSSPSPSPRLESSELPINSRELDITETTPKTKAEKDKLIELAHENGHFGTNAMLSHFKRHGIAWPKMSEDIKSHLKRCLECLRYNVGRHGFHPIHLTHAMFPMDSISLDHCGPFPRTKNGNEYILVAVDRCSRFCWISAVKDVSAATTASSLFHLFSTFGFPKVMVSDNGTAFVNKVIQSLSELA